MPTHNPQSAGRAGGQPFGIVVAALLSACGQGKTGESAGDGTYAIVPAPPYHEPYGAPGASAAYEAALAFRDALSDEQANVLTLPIDSPLRGNWSNLPATMVDFDHNGVRIGDLMPEQLARLYDFLAAALGRRGYDTVAQVVAAEAVLGQSLWATLGGISEGNYWLAFFGEPTPSGAWGWQLGGHHLAVNGSFAGGKAIGLSPTFVGAEPATFTIAGLDAAPLAEELEAGRAVMRSLPAKLQAEATIESPRMQAGAGRDGRIPEVRGSAVANWPDEPRALLLQAIRHWVALQPAEHAALRMAELEETVANLHFGWSGMIEEDDDDTYFRIQGPTLIIEFSVEDVDEGGHFHSVYRDPTNEYGRGARNSAAQRFGTP